MKYAENRYSAERYGLCPLDRAGACSLSLSPSSIRRYIPLSVSHFVSFPAYSFSNRSAFAHSSLGIDPTLTGIPLYARSTVYPMIVFLRLFSFTAWCLYTSKQTWTRLHHIHFYRGTAKKMPFKNNLPTLTALLRNNYLLSIPSSRYITN